MKTGLAAWKILLFPGVIAGAMFLSYLIDNDLEMGWPTNVVRNWQEFGLLPLHGQLAFNPGGYEATTHPQIYNGMSPVFLYPVYFAAELFGWTGLDTQAFHILLILVVLWAAWNLAGRDHFALIAAVLTVLCPSYLRWPKDFDPGALSVLPILPYAVIVLAILKKPKLTPGLAAILLALTLGMVSLNWTSAWACGPFVFLILLMPGLNRRGIIFVLAVMAAVIPLIAAVSVAAKYGSGVKSGIMSSGDVLGNYTWGHSGYGEDMTAGRAFIRIAFANGIGMLPLWLVLAYAGGRRLQNGGFSWLMLAPLGMAFADLVIMRNYFGHHPWMAGPVLIVGVFFSLALLATPPVETKEQIPFGLVPTLGLAGFAYGLAVLLFLRANEADLLALAQLVRENTSRSDTLVIENADSATAGMAARLDEQLDRRIITVDDFKELAGEKDHWVVLSAVKLDDSFSLLAQSRATSRLAGAGDWFNHTIAKRTHGDRLALSDTYFLYEPKAGTTP